MAIARRKREKESKGLLWCSPFLCFFPLFSFCWAFSVIVVVVVQEAEEAFTWVSSCAAAEAAAAAAAAAPAEAKAAKKSKIPTLWREREKWDITASDKSSAYTTLRPCIFFYFGWVLLPGRERERPRERGGKGWGWKRGGKRGEGEEEREEWAWVVSNFWNYLF